MAQSDRGTVAIGIILGVLASMSGTAGKQCMRFSELQRRKGTPAAVFVGRVAMALGLAFSAAFGPLIDLASYAFAPQSVIAPLGALDVVWNTLTAPFTLGETLTLRLSLGCCVIVVGALTSSLVGSHDPGDWDMEDIQRILLRPTVGYYLMALSCWLAFNILVLMPRSAGPPGKPWVPGNHVRGLSLGMTAGSIAGNMFCVKAFVEVCQASVRDGNGDNWAHWFPYGLFAAALVFAFSNLYFLTKAMREYEALFMGAVFEGSLIISACVSGVVVFSELERLAFWQIAMYWAAILAIVIGIWIVSCGSRTLTREEKALDADMTCDIKGACCTEDAVTDSKLRCAEPVADETEVDTKDTSVEHLSAKGLPSTEPYGSELPAARLSLFGKKAEMESGTIPGLSGNTKSKEISSEGCRFSCARSAGSHRVSQARKDDNGGAPCTDCAACLCGVSLDLIHGPKTWDMMSGLLVMSKTPRERPSSGAVSVHPGPRSF